MQGTQVVEKKSITRIFPDFGARTADRSPTDCNVKPGADMFPKCLNERASRSGTYQPQYQIELASSTITSPTAKPLFLWKAFRKTNPVPVATDQSSKCGHNSGIVSKTE